MTAVLIPAYEPEEILAEYAKSLSEMGFSVVVADDGSGPDYAGVFSCTAKYAHVLSFPVNRGKGAVLKSLYSYVLESMPDCTAVVTADSDGQHALDDVKRISDLLASGEEFVLGLRDIGKNAPIMSRIGNGLSRVVFALSASYWLRDNQTGLRGFSRKQLSWMLNVDGDRFDYELSVLWQAALQGVRMKLIPIQTIYFNNNSGTHFRKVKDTVLLYLTLAKCNRAAVACRIAVFLSLLLISVFAGGIPWFLAMPVSWLAGKLVCLALRKMGRFKGLPLKGALREAGHSLFGLCLTLAVSAGLDALWPECPIVLSWVAGRAIALPLRYFFCKMLSQSAFSAERSSLSSAPK